MQLKNLSKKPNYKNMKKILISIALLSVFSSCATFDNQETKGHFPAYGNWCGPKHPKENTNPNPIDRTDLACKHHDVCYDSKGYFNAECDNSLVAELKSFVPENEVESIARKTVISYFRRSPKL